MAEEKLTPLMEQYFRIKKDYPDKILFFRMGDFYEMFGDDAEEAAPILQIALTSRAHGKANRLPLAGIPYHAMDKYLARLIEAGKKVVICEQTENPKLAKGLVKREVVEIVTPGTFTPAGDNGHRPNYLATVVVNGDSCALSYMELSTGEFYVESLKSEDMIDRLRTISPSEVVLPESDDPLCSRIKLYLPQASLSRLEDWKFDYDTALQKLLDLFRVDNLEGFGISNGFQGISAAGAILYYLEENKLIELKHIRGLKIPRDDSRMFLDQATIENLELFSSASGKSLYSILNRTRTAMGARFLARALQVPLQDLASLKIRQDNLQLLVDDRRLLEIIAEHLKLVSDLERIAGRLGRFRAGPRDLTALAVSLKSALNLIENADKLPVCETLLGDDDLHAGAEIVGLIETALVDDPPTSITDGHLIRPGYDTALDDLKASISSSQKWIAGLQAVEKERTGIPSLKVGFNKVFGYYIEVSRSYVDKVPDEYVRKQTLVSAERYITDELKQKEELILSAEEKINSREETLFLELREKLSEWIGLLQKISDYLAEMDFYHALALSALSGNYIRPELNDSDRIEIRNGRHPVIEQILPSGKFVPNDTSVDTHRSQIHLITGPNMAGKSTYLRQVGQLVLMAQVGAYIPAESATIGLVDRIFTRVGATDKITLGQSTFLVEMNESANILNNCTEKSLILLDEIGRGTSTYDGLSIAWAVAEYLHETEGRQARTLFATHYHELTRLSERFKRIKNFQVAVKEWQDQIIFIRKIIPGGCDDSYGIFVARLAGVPQEVTERARVVLRQLEKGIFFGKADKTEDQTPETLFDHKYGGQVETWQKVIEKLQKADPNQTTPLEALNLLVKLKQMLEDNFD